MQLSVDYNWDSKLTVLFLIFHQPPANRPRAVEKDVFRVVCIYKFLGTIIILRIIMYFVFWLLTWTSWTNVISKCMFSTPLQFCIPCKWLASSRFERFVTQFVKLIVERQFPCHSLQTKATMATASLQKHVVFTLLWKSSSRSRTSEQCWTVQIAKFMRWIFFSRPLPNYRTAQRNQSIEIY